MVIRSGASTTTAPTLDKLPPFAPLAEVESALRRLAAEVADLDPLGREIKREWARRELRRIRFYAPVRLLDAALPARAVDVGEVLHDLAAYLKRVALSLECRRQAPDGAAPGREA